jgi:hypothetical protein
MSASKGELPRSGPPVEQLTRRLAECPEEFLLEPRLAGSDAGRVDVAAVVADLLAAFGSPTRAPEAGLSPREVKVWTGTNPSDRNLLSLTLVAAWLCHDRALREMGGLGPAVRRWLLEGLPPLAAVVASELFVSDGDRREELARALLDALGLLPAGETQAQSADRLRALSSVERARVIEATRAQQQRARELREQMVSERARQAAARYSSE